MKKLIVLMLITSIGLLGPAPVMAKHGGDTYKCPILKKVKKKAHFFLSNSEAIGLSEDQIVKIKSIKYAAKKALIRQGADMKIFELEIKERLMAKPVDQASINAMMDDAAGGWAEGGKQAVQSYVDLKAVLSESQMTKAKEIWRSQD